MNTPAIVEFKSGDAVSLGKVKNDSIVEDRSIDQFQRELHEYVNAHPGTALHLDLSQVHFFSSTVLSDLLEIQQELRQTNGSLRLHGVHGNVRAIMKLTGMGKMFTVNRAHVS